MTEPSAPSRTVVAVQVDGAVVGTGLGRAGVVAVAEVADGTVTAWTEHPVGWDVLHGQGAEGSHHARIVRFLREHGVQAVATGHVGAPMYHTLTKLGCTVLVGATGDARTAAITAAQQYRAEHGSAG